MSENHVRSVSGMSGYVKLAMSDKLSGMSDHGSENTHRITVPCVRNRRKLRKTGAKQARNTRESVWETG